MPDGADYSYSPLTKRFMLNQITKVMGNPVFRHVCREAKSLKIKVQSQIGGGVVPPGGLDC